jgi:hypothetical protein
VERHRLDRLAFEGTALADHGVEEVLPGLTPLKTHPEVVVKSTKFIKKSVDILGVSSNLGMENASPSVRYAGNILCLLRGVISACGSSVCRENQCVKCR